MGKQECFCRHGQAAMGAACVSPGFELCMKCDKDYHMLKGKCRRYAFMGQGEVGSRDLVSIGQSRSGDQIDTRSSATPVNIGVLNCYKSMMLDDRCDKEYFVYYTRA